MMNIRLCLSWWLLLTLAVNLVFSSVHLVAHFNPGELLLSHSDLEQSQDIHLGHAHVGHSAHFANLNGEKEYPGSRPSCLHFHVLLATPGIVSDHLAAALFTQLSVDDTEQKIAFWIDSVNQHTSIRAPPVIS